MSEMAHEEPVVSVEAGRFKAWSFTSPKSFFQIQVNYGKDYNLGMGTQSSNWYARPNEMSVLSGSSIFHETSAAPEMSVFHEKSTALETSVFSDLSIFHETSATLKTSTGSTFPALGGPTFPMTEHLIQISAIGGHPF